MGHVWSFLVLDKLATPVRVGIFQSGAYVQNLNEVFDVLQSPTRISVTFSVIFPPLGSDCTEGSAMMSLCQGYQTAVRWIAFSATRPADSQPKLSLQCNKNLKISPQCSCCGLAAVQECELTPNTGRILINAGGNQYSSSSSSQFSLCSLISWLLLFSLPSCPPPPAAPGADSAAGVFSALT